MSGEIRLTEKNADTKYMRPPKKRVSFQLQLAPGVKATPRAKNQTVTTYNNKTGRVRISTFRTPLLRLSEKTKNTYLRKSNAIMMNVLPRGVFYTYKRGDTRYYISPSTLLTLIRRWPEGNFKAGFKTHNNNGTPLTNNVLKARLRNLFLATKRLPARATPEGRAKGNPLFVDPHTRTIVTNLNIGLQYKRR
jgi:hypothetical protein